MIDIHTHIAPRFVVEQARAGDYRGHRVDENGIFWHPGGVSFPLDGPEYYEPVGKIEKMDEQELEMSVVSMIPTLFFHDQPVDFAVQYSRDANDAFAEFIDGRRDRLAAFATLALQDPEESAKELERTVTEHGFVGAQIGTTNAGLTIDAPEMEVVLATAERLDVPIMLHPYYLGFRPGLEKFHFINTIGNPLETCIAAARLMHYGTLAKFPGLKIILSHGGGYLPYQLGRLDHAFGLRDEPKEFTHETPSSQLDHFWLDTITHSPAALHFMAEVVGRDHVLVGTDAPFDMADTRPIGTVRDAGLDPEELARNARRLLRLEKQQNVRSKAIDTLS
jgi:aminocarboxymuconate-semialdehyde decarboxylase